MHDIKFNAKRMSTTVDINSILHLEQIGSPSKGINLRANKFINATMDSIPEVEDH